MDKIVAQLDENERKTLSLLADLGAALCLSGLIIDLIRLAT